MDISCAQVQSYSSATAATDDSAQSVCLVSQTPESVRRLEERLACTFL